MWEETSEQAATVAALCAEEGDRILKRLDTQIYDFLEITQHTPEGGECCLKTNCFNSGIIVFL